MAALQKIRSKGILLVSIIGLALFAFIAEDLGRALGIFHNDGKQQVGEVYGEKLSVNDYQAMIEEYTEAVKFTQGDNSLTDEQQNQLKDQVWQTYVNNKLIEHEAKKLGLMVTDDELKDVIALGNNPLLMQTPFRNEQTGRFDANMLQSFLKEYAKMQTSKTNQVPQEYQEYYQKLYKFWSFVEKTIRQNLLMNKYQALLGRSLVSNPISAKLSFESASQSVKALVASFSYNSVPDNSVTVTDEDLKKKYESQKENFRQMGESRDIKYIDVVVEASQADKDSLNKEMAEFQSELSLGMDVANTVRMSGSTVAYSALPVSKKSLPDDIQRALDSLSVGVVKAPFYTPSDNSMNLIKLLSVQSLPDSVQYSIINIPTGADKDGAKNRADSIVAALGGGCPFDTLAAKYGQNGAKQWLTTAAYENSTVDEDNRKFINTLNNMAVGETRIMEMAGGFVVAQVYARDNFISKYDVAVIKRPVEFSKETYTTAYNAFSHFVAKNKTLKDIEANAAKSGYRLLTRGDMFNNEHYVAGVPSTREAMKWIFDAEVNDVSPLYECGNNDHLLLVALTGIHKEGYRSLDEENIKQFTRTLVLRDKKAEKLMKELKNVNSIQEAMKHEGVSIDTLKDVNFNTPAFVASTGTTEPVLTGGLCAAKVSSVSKPVKGNNGVYIYQVLSRETQNGKFDDQSVEANLNQMNLRGVSQFVNELYRKAKVKDKRYLFF